MPTAKAKANSTANAKAKPGRSTPTHMYNAMIHPLQPYAFRGALWYQGESNRADGLKYQAKMRALIQGWRTVWNNSDMPFYFVQLAPFRYGGDPKLLPAIWQAQLNTLKLPHTGMAVTTDITTLGDIHPPNKQDVGKRLALWALAKTYSQKGFTYSGPLFEKVDQAEGEGSLTVWFKKATTGGLKPSNGKPVSHFEIAGKDGKWHPAEATIVYGDHLIVSSKAVKQPKHVRFGWDQLATPNLINGARLPASPFTATVGKKH